MDELRVALLIAGLVVVAGIYVFARFSRRKAARREDGPESMGREPPRKNGGSPERGAPSPRGGDVPRRGASPPKGGDVPRRSASPGSQQGKRAARGRRDVEELGGMFAVRRDTPDAELSVDVGILAGLRATYESTMDGTLGDGIPGDGAPGDGALGDSALGGVPEAASDLPRRDVPASSPASPPNGLPEPSLDDDSPDGSPGGVAEGSPYHPPGDASEGVADRPRYGVPDRSPDRLADDNVSAGSPDHPLSDAPEGVSDRPRYGVPDRSPNRLADDDASAGSPDHPLDGASEDSVDRPPAGVPEDSLGYPSGADSEDPLDRPAPDRRPLDRPPLDHPAPARPTESAAPGSAETAPPPAASPPRPSGTAGEPLAVDMSRPLLYLTLVSKQERLSGQEVLDALDAEGFRPGLLQLYYWRSDEEPSVKFGVANMVEPGILDPDALAETETPGLVPFMSVPRDSGSAFRILDTMVAVSRRLARRLDATLGDDTRSTLTAQAENHLREKIAEVLRRDRI